MIPPDPDLVSRMNLRFSLLTEINNLLNKEHKKKYERLEKLISRKKTRSIK